ncbi:MAG: hypothetical protein JW818_16430 [Pirellulales bacterium]|nr:hypothetical protein [Pirellulales bacterium]
MFAVTTSLWAVECGVVGALIVILGPLLLGIRFIPNSRVGIVEKLWSPEGTLAEGHLIALDGEAGYQSEVLRGGLHFFYWPWQYRIHKVPLVVVSEGRIGYVFARDGQPLQPQQTLGRTVPCNSFQDARAFLMGYADEPDSIGQRGRQRAILREGVYPINLVLFVVITDETSYQLNLGGKEETRAIARWHQELCERDGFEPVVVGSRELTGEQVLGASDTPETIANDDIAVVTVHDGPALESGEIIAPPVGTDPGGENYHNNYQDIEAFLEAGGRRGRQLVPLTDGTFFINRWFATIEKIPKTIVPIGYVGVVVSYHGKAGHDVSGDAFRHGERVAEGDRGVQARTLCPGKYPFNTFAGHIHLVPTTNVVLHWITGRVEESHRYDESLKSIDLVTADAYEPVLPLSVVVHIDYQKAPQVVQRFGNIKKLITQTLDPLLSAYFRDIAHKKTMLALLHERDVIQQEAKAELRSRFLDFDIELVDVLIGKPDTAESSGEIETLLEQLRLRQLSREQIETYQQQSAAAAELRGLKMAQAKAEKQTELTNSQIEIEIAENQGGAELSRARKKAEQTVVTAEAEKKRRLLIAEAGGQSRTLLGEGQSKRISLEGEAEAAVLAKKIASYGDPRVYALALATQYLSQSQQPLVPERLFLTGGGSGSDGPTSQGLLGTLLSLLVADRTGFGISAS